jgi:hypothetical protein
MTLLGLSDEPGTLEGHGPIDPDAVRHLAGHAPSFTRILTHPITGTILDVDRTTYRVPADLKRWLRIRDRTCRFAGCGHPARLCEIDHSIRWTDDGPTASHNLADLCENHHHVKDKSRWRMQHLANGRLRWTSPTGHVTDSDPPPF